MWLLNDGEKMLVNLNRSTPIMVIRGWTIRVRKRVVRDRGSIKRGKTTPKIESIRIMVKKMYLRRWMKS
jgi:hypothetical protein